MSAPEPGLLPFNGDGQPLVPQEDWNEEQRAYEAQKLRTAGHDWKEIAQYAGYPSSGAARVSVQLYLQRASLSLSKDAKADALDLEMQRLDGLIKAYWPTAIAGEVKHAELVLRVIAQQSKMLGLEELVADKTETQRTIIITGPTAQYAQALQAVVENSAKAIEIPSGDIEL